MTACFFWQCQCKSFFDNNFCEVSSNVIIVFSRWQNHSFTLPCFQLVRTLPRINIQCKTLWAGNTNKGPKLCQFYQLCLEYTRGSGNVRGKKTSCSLTPKFSEGLYFSQNFTENFSQFSQKCASFTYRLVFSIIETQTTGYCAELVTGYSFPPKLAVQSQYSSKV